MGSFSSKSDSKSAFEASGDGDRKVSVLQCVIVLLLLLSPERLLNVPNMGNIVMIVVILNG